MVLEKEKTGSNSWTGCMVEAWNGAWNYYKKKDENKSLKWWVISWNKTKQLKYNNIHKNKNKEK